ncbi:thiamine diphosphokinase [Polaribacter tangerinus]|uniref:thiamine diphosphokinase n=1 Tax=Polaribacter tangerinus TaxID=1920034 RepID=UPI001E64025E|nr:thiamine diphosphokinase [Polaribacter tangerinus]
MMKTTRVFLLLNGKLPQKIPNLSGYDIICATDGAYNYLKENNIVPDFIAGDFDSIKSLAQNIETFHTPNQNFTDFDKIVEILIQKGCTEIDVFGASGKEQDHFIGNLSTAIHYKNRLKMTFYDAHGYYFLAEQKVNITNCLHKTISLIPMSFVSEVYTEGLEYELVNEHLEMGKKIGTRNKAIKNNISINHTNGNLFVFVND